MKLYHNWGMSEYLYRFWLYINICLSRGAFENAIIVSYKSDIFLFLQLYQTQLLIMTVYFDNH